MKLISGAPKMEWYNKTASTALKNGIPVKFTSGQLVAADASSAGMVGIIGRDVVSTDSDFASAIRVPVFVAEPNCVFEADVKWGVTPTAAQEGGNCDLFVGTNGTDGVTGEIYIDTATNSHHQFTIVKVLQPAVAASKTAVCKVLVRFNNTNYDVAAA